MLMLEVLKIIIQVTTPHGHDCVIVAADYILGDLSSSHFQIPAIVSSILKLSFSLYDVHISTQKPCELVYNKGLKKPTESQSAC